MGALDFRYVASCQRRKVRQFRIFDPCKNYGGVDEMSKSKRSSITGARQGESFRFPRCCFILKPPCVRGDRCRKSRQNFTLFDTSVKLRRGPWAKGLSHFYDFSLCSNLWYTFEAVWEIGALLSKRNKGREAKHKGLLTYTSCGLNSVRRMK